MSISSIESLPYDILLKVISFAVLENAKSLLFANKSLIKYFYQKQVWKSLLEGCNLFSIQMIIRHLTCNSSSTIHQLLLRQLQEVVREVSRTSNPQQVKWHQIPSFSGAPVISRMEGHGMVTIADRYIAIVCAWGNQVRNNTIKIVDGWATPTAILPITTSTWDVPGNFRYGFSATVYKNEVIVYGGCLEGGYGGDCNDLYRINFSFEKRNSSQSSEQFDKFPLTEESYEMIANAPVKYWDRVVSSYSPNLKKTAPRQSTVSSSITPTQVNGCSRAYHAAAILHYRQRDHLMVFGGIHHHQSIFRMELYDINNDQWTAAEYEGNAPSPRFGCSCVPIPSVSTSDYSTTNRYIVTGGSDGSDLCRDGDELTDLFVLDVVRGHDGMSDKLVWTKVIKSSPFVAERCHSAVYFNDHVIYFGGGALTSSYTRILSIKSLNKLLEEERKEEEGGVLSVLYDESDPTAIFQPTLLPRSNNYPPARLDGKAVMIGSQMIIFGGFSRRSRELGDFWSLDLSPGVKAFDRLRSPLTEEGEEGESEVNEGLKALRSLFAEKLQGGEGEESCSNIEIEEEEGNGDANEENEVNMTNDFLNHFILQNPIFAQLMQQGMFSIFGGEEEDPDEDEEWEAEEADDDDDEDNEEDENEDEKENEEVEDDETL